MPSVNPVAEIDQALFSRDRAAPRLADGAEFAKLLNDEASDRDAVPIRPAEPRPVRREVGRLDTPPSRDLARTDRADRTASEDAPEAETSQSNNEKPKPPKPTETASTEPRSNPTDAAEAPPAETQTAVPTTTSEDPASFDTSGNSENGAQEQPQADAIEPSPDDEAAAQAEILINMVLAAPLPASPAGLNSAALPVAATVAALPSATAPQPVTTPAATTAIGAMQPLTPGNTLTTPDGAHPAQSTSPAQGTSTPLPAAFGAQPLTAPSPKADTTPDAPSTEPIAPSASSPEPADTAEGSDTSATPEPQAPVQNAGPPPPKPQSDRAMPQMEMSASAGSAKTILSAVDANTPTITIDNPRPANPTGNSAPQGTPTAAGNVPVREAVPIERLAFEIIASARDRVREIEVRLDPPELGRIDVTLDIDEVGKVTTRLVVEKSETLDQLRRDAQTLERALNDAGLKTDSGSLQFSLRDGQNDRREDTERRGKRGHVALTTDEINAWRPVDASARTARGGIDVRI